MPPGWCSDGQALFAAMGCSMLSSTMGVTISWHATLHCHADIAPLHEVEATALHATGWPGVRLCGAKTRLRWAAGVMVAYRAQPPSLIGHGPEALGSLLVHRHEMMHRRCTARRTVGRRRSIRTRMRTFRDAYAGSRRPWRRTSQTSLPTAATACKVIGDRAARWPPVAHAAARADEGNGGRRPCGRAAHERQTYVLSGGERFL